MQNRGDQPAHNHNQNSKQIETQPGNAQRGEKPRPHLYADGINKKDQAEFLDKVQHIAAQRHPSLIDEVADDNTAEQNAANTKADTAHFNVADP